MLATSAIIRRVSGRQRGLDPDTLDPMAADLWNEHVAKSYDATSAPMFAADVVNPTVDFLARLRAGAARWSSPSAPAAWPSRCRAAASR